MLVRVGDPLLGSTLRRFMTAGPTAHFFYQGGDAVIGVELEDNRTLYLGYRNGDFANAPEQVRINCRCGVYTHTAAGTLIFYSVPGATILGVWRNDGTLSPIQTIGQPLLGKTVQDIEAATMDAGGRVRLIARAPDGSARLIETGTAEPRVLLGKGQKLPLSVPSLLRELIEGSQTVPPVVSS